MEQPEFKTLRKGSLGIFEVYIWTTLALVFSLRLIMAYLEFRSVKVFYEYYWDFLISVFVFLFPYLFRLTFSEYPFEYIRNERRSKQIEQVLEKFDDRNIETSIKTTTDERKAIEEFKEVIEIEEKKKQEEEIDTLYRYLKQSQSISEKIYNRSGVYLLVGCLIAFAGVLFFYFQSANLHTTITDLTKPFDFGRTVLEYLPRLGTLVFVEAIAFFFLKQYRVTMEEYRYYEAIKRQRENQVAILKISKQHLNNHELLDKIITLCSFNENPNKLAQNETTQVLEAHKINLNDSDIIDKLIEIIKVAKK